MKTSHSESDDKEASLVRTINSSLIKFNESYKTNIPAVSTVIISGDMTGARVAQFNCTSCSSIIKLYSRQAQNNSQLWVTSNFLKHLNQKHHCKDSSFNPRFNPELNRFVRGSVATANVPLITSHFDKLQSSKRAYEVDELAVGQTIDLAKCDLEFVNTIEETIDLDLDLDRAKNSAKDDDVVLDVTADIKDVDYNPQSSSGED